MTRPVVFLTGALAASAVTIPLLLLAPSPAACPDYSPPPGALNPAVTQATIGSTICAPGWTRTVRPPTSYTTPLKARQIAERNLPGTAADYEEDHFVPLAIGGAPSAPANLWPELIAQAHLKDAAETRLQRAVCAHKITLAEAQWEIGDPRNWHA